MAKRFFIVERRKHFVYSLITIQDLKTAQCHTFINPGTLSTVQKMNNKLIIF